MKRLLSTLLAGCFLCTYAQLPEIVVDELITEPTGKKVVYSTACDNAYNYYTARYRRIDRMVTEMVYDTDGKTVYMKEPFAGSNYTIAGWLKGSIDGNKITFDFPQLINQIDWYGSGDYTNMYADIVYKIEDDGTTTWQGSRDLDPEKHRMVFTISSDGSITSENTTDDADGLASAMIGYIYDFSILDPDDASDLPVWNGYASANFVMTPYTGPTVHPDGATIEPWTVSYTDENGNQLIKKVNVSTDTYHMYISGLYSNSPDACIKIGRAHV